MKLAKMQLASVIAVGILMTYCGYLFWQSPVVFHDSTNHFARAFIISEVVFNPESTFADHYKRPTVTGVFPGIA